jgi:hypothetical protein
VITASKVSIVRACPGSVTLPVRNEKHDGQEEGDERHEELESEVNAGDIPATLTDRWPDYKWRSEVAFALNLHTGEARALGVGMDRAYPDLGPSWIYGTADLEGRGPSDEMVIVDRKSFDPNVKRAAENDQLHTLAVAAAHAHDVADATVAIWHEVRPLDVHAMDAFDLDAYLGELREVAKAADTARARVRQGLGVIFKTGSHCRWCDAFHDCPEQKALAVQVSNDEVSSRIEMSIPFRDDEQAADAYELMNRLGMMHKRLKSALIARATEKPFKTRGNMMFGAYLAEGNDKLDGDIVYDTIREMHGQNVADAAVERKATKKRIKDALSFVAGKGQGAATERNVLAEVKKRGGISNKTKTTVGEYPPALNAANE